MTIYCNYHPTAPASFDCELCDIYICDDCVVSKKEQYMGVTKSFHLCPKCNRDVQWLGLSNVLAPFWNRLPRFFVYPFFLKPLFLNLILCFVAMFFTGQSLVSALIRFAIWGIWLKYSFVALQATAKGSLVPPDVTSETISEKFSEVLKQIVLYFALIFGGVFVAMTFGKYAAILYGVAALLLLPAMIILMVVNESFFKALNPVAFIGLPIRIGWGYLIMYFFLAALGSAPMVVYKFASTILPANMVPFILLFFQNYYTLISYNLMGYVLLQYHEEIGYDVDYEDFVKEKSGKKKSKSSNPIVNEVDMHLKDLNYDKAMDILLTEINLNSSKENELWDRYYQLLKIKQMKQEMVAFGKKYIELLVKSKEESPAIQVYIECIGIDPQFAPEAKSLIKLGAWLKKAGQQKEAIQAYSTFTKIYKEDPMIPTVYFRAAEIFNEIGQSKKAKGMLNAVIQKYPEHDIIPFVKNYLRRIPA